MAQLTDGTKINCSSELPHGINVIKDGEVSGYKYFEKCKIQQTWQDWISGTHRVSDLCWAKVSVKKGGTIVRPFASYEEDGTDIIVASNDLRSDKLHIDQLKTPCGKKCVSARSPFRYTDYSSHSDNSCDNLDKSTSKICEPGLHFYPTLEILKRYIPGGYSVTSYGKNKVVVGSDNKTVDELK